MNFTEVSGILSVCVTEGLGTGLVGMPAQDVLIGEKIISMALVSQTIRLRGWRDCGPCTTHLEVQ